MNALSKLAKEAAAWKLEKKTLKGPQQRDHFIIEPDGRMWRLSIFPAKGLPSFITGLTFPEAHRRRLSLSSEGYIGKVVGGAQ